MAGYYLGIDGGQSSTVALIGDESGRVIGQGHGGPCNHVTGPQGREKFARAVGDCLTQACEEASLDASALEFTSACCGFSGGAEDKQGYAREFIRSRRYKITHDAEIALAGALAGEPGIVVIAGTGSIAFGRNQRGETARAGGWGYIFGDEGSAFDLVRRGLRAALQYEEGWGEATQLYKLLLSVAGEATANALLHRFYAVPRAEIARYAPLINSAAEQHDQVAQKVVDESATALASYVHGVRSRLFGSLEPIAVALIGGVFQSEVLSSALSRHIEEFGCHTVRARFSPAAGALIEAFRLEGRRPELSNVPGGEKSATHSS
jgi:N-acetylglucosamine kinase-like BadF-type ATPase